MVEGLVDQVQEVFDELAKDNPPIIIEEEEYWEIAKQIT